jgi:hypothetical protein
MAVGVVMALLGATGRIPAMDVTVFEIMPHRQRPGDWLHEPLPPEIALFKGV